jgi:hypothetical protein
MTNIRPLNSVQASDTSVVQTAADDFSYDAFISYSGFRKPGDASQFDQKVAERLHRSLESYRVPRALLKKASGRAPIPRRLKKIFRDRDEVRASSNLNHSLTEALRRSRFLIVVCSPRARRSQWINQEIAIFHSLGRSEQILPLLIEGDPAEAFPEELFKAQPEKRVSAQRTSGAPEKWLAQPLAADIRAPSVAKSLRILKQEKLRLLAAIIGCDYDDLRQREHERFVRRMIMASAAMLALVFVLTSLSVGLFFAQQRASRNAELALNASAEILPAVALEPDSPYSLSDPTMREVHANNAITYLETLRQDDPENLKCLTILRALYSTLASLLTARDRKVEAQAAYEKAGGMSIPITLSRLRAWKPTEAKRVKEFSGKELSFPVDYDLNRLRTLLSIMEQPDGAANIKNAVEYCDRAAEYLLLLDTTTGAGKAEARRVLRSGLNKLQRAQLLEALTPPQQELFEAIKTTLDRIPDD